MGTLQILGMGGYESAKCQKIHIKKGFHIKKKRERDLIEGRNNSGSYKREKGKSKMTKRSTKGK
jgi:hypothetical protein